MSNSPPLPWYKGSHKDHSVAVVEVEVCRVHHTGHVFSTHHLQDQVDNSVVMAWPGGGQEQVAFALLTEAVRREAILEFLVQMSHDPEWLPTLQAMSDEERDTKFKELGVSLTKVVQNIVDGIAENCVREAYGQFTPK